MCGIAGVVDLDAREPLDADHLIATLRHRGPDAAGVHVRPGVAIGQSRLSIIDLVTGDPPITNEDGAIGVAFNGEIYNYRGLRRELIDAGHEFKTVGDTEVIAHLAETLDAVALCRRLDGMFAFAVWDERATGSCSGATASARSRSTTGANGHRLVFGSEIKAVLAHPRVPRSLEPGGDPGLPHLRLRADAADVLRRRPQRAAGPRARSTTPGDDAAHRALLGARRSRGRRRPPRLDGPRRAAALECAAASPRGRAPAGRRRAARRVPERRHRLLGGRGVDGRVSDQPVRPSRSASTTATGFDERPYARAVARRYGTDHTEFVVQPDAADLIERLVWHHDQPFGDSSALPTYLLTELTREHVTVALCGDGGDELFAGYERFAAGLLLDQFDRLPASVRRGVTSAAALVPGHAFSGRAGSAQRMLTRSSLGMPWAYLSWINYAPDDVGASPGAAPWASDDYAAHLGGAGAHPLDRLLHLNLRTYLLDDLLVKVDRMAMAHGLEVRSPFLDTALAEFVLRLPPRSKIRGTTLKWALKDVVRDLLPREIVHRRKRGFGVPLDRWFRTSLRSFARSRLDGPGSRVRQHLHGEAVTALLDEHDRGTNHGHTIWTLLTLEVFLRHAGW